MSEPFPAATTETIRTAIETEHGYLSWLGTRVETVEAGRVVLAIPYDTKLTNTTQPPTVHGGVAATLVDTAGALAQRTAFDDPEAGSMATINLNVNYLERADGDLIATAEVIRAGGSVGVSKMCVESPTADGDTKTVAVAQGSYRLFRESPQHEYGE